MGAAYDAKWVESYFDEYADKEWDRLRLTPAREVQLDVHAAALMRNLTIGMEVLEVGAGPGRFTHAIVELLESYATVTDISQVQLDLNKAKAEEHGFAHGVREWRQLDICDMSCYGDASFDAVLAYGGPLSYVLDRRDEALRECIRVTKPGGIILASVMCLWGTIHEYLDGVLGYSGEENKKIVATGDLTAENAKFASHFCHLFRSAELRAFFESHGLEVVDMAACNVLTSVYGDRLLEARKEKARWVQVLRMELEACREPGCLDMGTHLIIAGRKAS